MLTYHCQSFEEPEERVHQARALLQFLTESAEKDTAFGTFLGEESELFNRVTDDYLFHDHLEGHNEAVYFHEFIERASGAGLQYLGEPFLGLMATRNFPDEVERTLQRVATDTIDVEQYMDFLRNRSFRMTLLVRQEHEIDRTISPERLNDLYLSAPLAPDSGDPFSLPKIFDHGERRLEALDPATSETFSLLSERWPEHIAFEEIVGEVEQRLAGWPETDWEQPDDLGAYIAEHLIHCAVASLVFIHAMSPRFTTKVTDFPRAGAWARQQASEGKRVTNQKHEIVELDDPARWLLERLDGTSSIGQLANDLRERVDSGDFEWQVDEPGDHAEAAVRAYLEEFRAGALLLPEFPESV
ncbi:MAG: methyltransferase regulatory domain-containing protein [Planctomycetota bacterium]